MTNEEYLVHYGIKGMKWGVRRSPEELGHLPRIKVTVGKNDSDRVFGVGIPKGALNFVNQRVGVFASKSPEKLRKGVAQAKIKKTTDNVKDVSDEELKKKIARAELEVRYKQLSKSFGDVSKELKNVSDTDLQKKVERLALEDRYLNAKSQTRSDMSREVEQALMTYGGMLLSAAVLAGGKKIVNSILFDVDA